MCSLTLKYLTRYLKLWFYLCMSLLFLTPASAQQNENLSYVPELKVGIIGDQTFSIDLDASYVTLQNGVNVLGTKNLDLVLHVGDLVESGESEDAIRDRFQQAESILDQLPAPWYLTAGDHDVNPPLFEQNSSDRSREALFQELYGARVPEFLQHPYYSFDISDYHFIALYSHERLHSDPRFGNIFLARITAAQRQWLAQDLEDNKHAKGIVVFIHQPLWYHASGWRPIHNLLKKYKVAAVISGHFHYDQNSGRFDGIRYITVGATGGFVKQGSRDVGNMQHVSVLTLKGSKADIELIPLTDNLPLTLTPQLQMDRAQAIDVVLGGLFSFASNNPVFVKDGSLVDDCDNPQPATIEISEIGNPSDTRIDVNIGFSASTNNVELLSPGFTAGECEQAPDAFNCVLAPNARITLANYSSAEVGSFFTLLPPLWQSGLTVVGGDPVGTVLNFDIRLELNSKLYLQRTVSTTVAACP